MAAPIPPRRLTAAERASVTGDKLVSNLNEAARRLASEDRRTIQDVRSSLTLFARRLELLHDDPDEFGIYRYLDVSTRHLPDPEIAAIADHFADHDDATPIVDDHPYGWWLHVAEDEAELGDAFKGACPATMRILRKAHALGCLWVKLDADGDVHPDLPVREEA